jgi:hypothetical protein
MGRKIDLEYLEEVDGVWRQQAGERGCHLIRQGSSVHHFVQNTNRSLWSIKVIYEQEYVSTFALTHG